VTVVRTMESSVRTISVVVLTVGFLRLMIGCLPKIREGV
jgi:hypothetical protein